MKFRKSKGGVYRLFLCALKRVFLLYTFQTHNSFIFLHIFENRRKLSLRVENPIVSSFFVFWDFCEWKFLDSRTRMGDFCAITSHFRDGIRCLTYYNISVVIFTSLHSWDIERWIYIFLFRKYNNPSIYFCKFRNVIYKSRIWIIKSINIHLFSVDLSCIKSVDYRCFTNCLLCKTV